MTDIYHLNLTIALQQKRGHRLGVRRIYYHRFRWSRLLLVFFRMCANQTIYHITHNYHSQQSSITRCQIDTVTINDRSKNSIVCLCTCVLFIVRYATNMTDWILWSLRAIHIKKMSPSRCERSVLFVGVNLWPLTEYTSCSRNLVTKSEKQFRIIV